MLRDNLVELIEPMLNSAGADPLALYIHTRTPASDDRLPCLKNPRPEGAESSLTESASSPFQAEPAHREQIVIFPHAKKDFEGRTRPLVLPDENFVGCLLALVFVDFVWFGYQFREPGKLLGAPF